MTGHAALRDRSPEELRAAYRDPSSSGKYRLGDVEGLFRSSIVDILPGGRAANADRVAWEMTWTKSGCDLTVRFVERGGRWRALEAFEAEVDTDY